MPLIPFRDRVYAQVSGVGNGYLTLGDTYSKYTGFDTLPQLQPFPLVLVERDSNYWQVICAQVSGTLIQYIETLASSDLPGGRDIADMGDPPESGSIKDAFICPPATFFQNTFPVTMYGAVGDGNTDDSFAIQRAISAAAQVNGTVLFPQGRFRVQREINVYRGVKLVGTTSTFYNQISSLFNNPAAGFVNYSGSIILHEYNGPSTNALFRLYAGASIDGLTFYDNRISGYMTSINDRAWCIRASDPASYYGSLSNGNSIKNVELVNVCKGILVWGGPTHIENIIGQPIYRGIESSFNGARLTLKNCTFGPYWMSTSSPAGQSQLFNFQKQSGICFRLGYHDDAHVANCFCLGYSIGFDFFKETNFGFERGSWAKVTSCETDTCGIGYNIYDGGPIQLGECRSLGSSGNAVIIDGVRDHLSDRNYVAVNNFNCTHFGTDIDSTQPHIDMRYGHVNFMGGQFWAGGSREKLFRGVSGTLTVNGIQVTGYTIPVRLESTLYRAMITNNILGAAVGGSAANQVVANNLS